MEHILLMMMDTIEDHLKDGWTAATNAWKCKQHSIDAYVSFFNDEANHHIARCKVGITQLETIYKKMIMDSSTVNNTANDTFWTAYHKKLLNDLTRLQEMATTL